MKRYLVFTGGRHTAGGINELTARADHESEAMKAGEEILEEWADILDTQMMMSKHRLRGALTWGEWVKVLL